MTTPQQVVTQPSRPRRANMRASLGKTTNPLFDAIMGGRGVNTKAACLIAAQIEEDLISKGWPTDTLYGSETQLVARFGVCRVVIREAARILESRGTAKMKRGPNGGLIVVELKIAVVLEGLHRYVHSLGTQSVQGAICCSLLATVHTQMQAMAAERTIQPMLAEFIGTLLSATEKFEHEGPLGHVRMGAAAAIAKSRAEQIFRMLMRDLDKGVSGDKRLGSELDLCDRYGADRSALRQAVRVLEFEGIAVSAAGRGKGLMTRTPDPAAVCRLINCYFAAAGLPTRDAMAFFKVLSSEAVAIAATTATDVERSRLEFVRDALCAATTEQIASVMQEAEDSQFAILQEPLIDILLRCAKSYSTWSSHLRNRPSADLDESYRFETLNVISAILQGDGTKAAAAQVRKVEQLDRFI